MTHDVAAPHHLPILKWCAGTRRGHHVRHLCLPHVAHVHVGRGNERPSGIVVHCPLRRAAVDVDCDCPTMIISGIIFQISELPRQRIFQDDALARLDETNSGNVCCLLPEPTAWNWEYSL